MTNKIDREFFAQYISYARKFVKPTIPEHVVQDLVNEYVKMRAVGNSTKTITATPR
jgi:DNA replicative helicase MCM subunit Mcm2 (Cdc46/Mcm family)